MQFKHRICEKRANMLDKMQCVCYYNREKGYLTMKKGGKEYAT